MIFLFPSITEHSDLRFGSDRILGWGGLDPFKNLYFWIISDQFRSYRVQIVILNFNEIRIRNELHVVLIWLGLKLRNRQKTKNLS